MKEILLVMTASAVLLVLCEVLIEGVGIKKYARFAIGIAVSAILAGEMVGIFSGELEDVMEYSVETGYLELVEDQLTSVVNSGVQAELYSRGYFLQIECEVLDNAIVSITATADSELKKETADEIGSVICEVAGVEMWQIIIKIDS